MDWNRLAKAAAAFGSALTMGCAPSITTIPERTPTPVGDTFVLRTSASSEAQTFTLANSNLGTVVNFYGIVAIANETEVVSYQETQQLDPNICNVPSGSKLVDAISFTFPASFTFSPNGSYGPNTGLLDTLFSTTATAPFTGAIYKAGSCTTPFSAAQQVYPTGGTPAYEYPGGGNTSVPAGTYILEIWDTAT
jgi:hypothetical protein